MVGSAEFFSGIDKLECKIKWNALYPQVLAICSNPLKTIYSVNMQVAYQTGRYTTQIENAEDRPYWEYVAILDSSTRPEHAMLNGMVFRYDDPFWKSFYPPNGWRCRCRVNALSQYKVDKSKITVSDSNGKLSDDLQLVSKKSGEYKPIKVYTD